MVASRRTFLAVRTQVHVDHERTAIVQICQSSGQVLKDGHFCGEGDVGCVLQNTVQAKLQSFHHQHREARDGKEVVAKKQHNIRMSYGGDEAAHAVVLVHRAPDISVLRCDEDVVEFLSRADQSAHFQLLHSPVEASAQQPIYQSASLRGG